MKLGGLTWWRSNYGSILQAYALQQQLNSYNGIEYEIICQYGKKVASASSFYEKLKRIGLRKSLKRAVWKFGLPKLRERNHRIQQFTDIHLNISDAVYNEHTIEQANAVYDGFVCGSDQIWNPDLVSTNSMYWLGFADLDKIKFSYAPSIGVNAFTEEQRKAIISNLESFTAISSREESGTKLINDALKTQKCVTVLDPTMLVNRNVWDELCAPRKYSKPYILVYMLRGTKKQRKLIESFAKRKNLPIVTMPFLDSERIELYDFVFGDFKFWDADPSDFISVIKNAEYVFTDSFHCMVFSCLYHTEFFTFPKIGKSQLNRVIGLQEMLGIKNRMITEAITIDDILHTEKISWVTVDAILEQKRDFSRRYIEKVLDWAGIENNDSM